MQTRPVNAILAIAAAALPLPLLWMVDRMSGPCGDGLCGFFSGVLVIGALVVATMVFLVRSSRRNERPGLLRVIPIVFWLAILPVFGIL
jgi:hypothetical protein